MTYWPASSDFYQAVRNGRFAAPALQSCRAVRVPGRASLRCSSGAYAITFELMTAQGQSQALRVFLKRGSADRSDRYKAISDFISSNPAPYLCRFTYIPLAIRVGTEAYPALTMEWVAGRTLDEWLRAFMGDAVELGRRTDEFVRMVTDMERRGFAHGDLQPGNIMIGDTLRLVDYDGMFVPALKGRTQIEAGLPNFQHPGRTSAPFTPEIDRFSSLIIWLSLVSAAVVPRLYDRVDLDKRLLLTERDLDDPNASPMVRALRAEPRLKAATEQLLAIWRGPFGSIPNLATFIATSTVDPNVVPSAPASQQSARVSRARVRSPTSPFLAPATAQPASAPLTAARRRKALETFGRARTVSPNSTPVSGLFPRVPPVVRSPATWVVVLVAAFLACFLVVKVLEARRKTVPIAPSTRVEVQGVPDPLASPAARPSQIDPPAQVPHVPPAPRNVLVPEEAPAKLPPRGQAGGPGGQACADQEQILRKRLARMFDERNFDVDCAGIEQEMRLYVEVGAFARRCPLFDRDVATGNTYDQRAEMARQLLARCRNSAPAWMSRAPEQTLMGQPQSTTTSKRQPERSQEFQYPNDRTSSD